MSWHSVEDLHANQKNRWKGWHCSSGHRSLYVDFDGNMYVGTCYVGGMLGNVFRQGPEIILGKWIVCTAEVCQCGSDMQSPKVKRRELVPEHVETLFRQVESAHPREVASVAQPEAVLSPALRDVKLVIWDLGRRCNYDCSYCFAEAHNSYEAHKSLGSLKHAIDFLKRWFCKGERTKFVITGGEPTVNPDYLGMLKYIVGGPEYHYVHTTTNGSRNAGYYSELIELSDVGFSAHLERLRDSEAYRRFLENIAACVAARRVAGTKAADHWLGVRIMLKPGTKDLALRLLTDVRALPDFDRLGSVSLSLLHDKEQKDVLLPYSEDELAFARESVAHPGG